MKVDLTEAIKIRVRYDTPNEKGQTRRDRNDDFDAQSPTLMVPPYARFIWDWYFEIADSVGRIADGICRPLPPSEFAAWVTVTGNKLHSYEYAFLRAMDLAYCEEMNKELADYQERTRDQQQQEIDAAKRK